jgi:superfamily II DNA or RNA helicase
MREMRPYQEETFQAIRETVRQKVYRMVVQLPTGAGKTLIAARIAEGALKKGGTLAFVVPSIPLIDQTVEAFWRDGVRDVGVIQADHGMTDYSKPIQVCSIQTLMARNFFPPAKVVIFDEGHLIHKGHKRWMEHPDFQTTPFICLSATPWTRGLGNYYQTLLIGATIAELIEQKYLCPFQVFAGERPDMKGVAMVGDDFNQGQSSKRMRQGTLTADIIRTWKEKWGKPKTLCFAVDRTHAENLRDRFIEAGVRCGYQDALTTPNERTLIKRRFHSGEYEVVVNIDTLSLGTDWDVRCLILGRPVRSESRYVQIIGRGLRLGEGKDKLVILDHSNTTDELGFVTSIHYDRLRTSKERKPPAPSKPKPKPPWECPQCTMLHSRGMKVCTNCGYERKFISGIIEDDGELVDVTNKKLGKKGKKREWTMAEKRIFYAELLGYAAERGYKSGWAANQYRARFDVWPRGMDDVVAVSPSVATRQWIKSRLIAWAKSKKRGGMDAAPQS